MTRHGVRRPGAALAALVLALPAFLALGPSAVSATQLPPLSAGAGAALSSNVDDAVIVVFKDQVPSVPDTPADGAARANAVQGLQSPVLNELAQTGARQVRSLRLVNAVSATVSPGEAQRLAADPAVAEVIPDEPVRLADTGATPGTGRPLATDRLSAAAAPGVPGLPPGTCPAGGNVQLNPQAVVSIHAASPSGTGDSAQALGYTGAGVKVGFIADGLDIDNPDFIRPDGQHVFVDDQDFSGSGTGAPTGGGEAFTDASSIAAQGRAVYDVAPYGGLPGQCLIRIEGSAPGASLVGLNVLGSSGVAFASVFLEAIDYAVTVDHVNVLNESFGSNPFPDTAIRDLTALADDAATAAGVTVTVSTGDAGVTNTIGSPATDPNVIAVGASTTFRAYAQTEVGGINLPGITGWLNDNVSAVSSAGVDQAGRTLDLVAPGDLNWALCTPRPARYTDCTDFVGRPSAVQLTGGTSESAPLAAGVAALVIQAYARAHAGADPTPSVVKQILTSTADDIYAPGDQQGTGLLDAYQAVLAAASFRGSTGPPRGHTVLAGADQLQVTGSPGSVHTVTEVLTNDGAGPATLSIGTRRLGAAVNVATTTTTLSDATGDLALVPFRVPPGQARLSASITFPGTAIHNIAQFSLVDPDGKFAAFNFPQGSSNFGNEQVADPASGLWTAIIFGVPASLGGFTGPVTLGVSVAAWVPFATVAPTSVSLASGASAPVTITVQVPTTPGDTAGSVLIGDSAATPAFAKTTTIPVTVRALVPMTAPAATFVGSLTGGNGRDVATGVSADYEFDVARGTPALNAEVTLPTSADSVLGELVDPVSGEAASTSSNTLLAETGTGSLVLAPQRGLQLHVLDPRPGRWVLVLDFSGPVSGTSLDQPYTVTVDRVPVAVGASGLPDAPTTRLAAGVPVTAAVSVTNHLSVPEEIFVDARRSGLITYPLVPANRAAVTVPITDPGQVPEYMVPSHTTAIAAGASAVAPVLFDYFWAFGDPDLAASPAATLGRGSFSAPDVASGLWAIAPTEPGPDGATGVVPETVHTALSATTLAFDPTVTAPTGDLWRQGVGDGSGLVPELVGAGQTVSIPVTITPQGSSGAVVSGTLFVSAVALIDGTLSSVGARGVSPQGSDEAALAYRYTVR